MNVDPNTSGQSQRGQSRLLDNVAKLTVVLARKLRIQYPGAVYHAMNRGDRRETIFLDERDRRRFLDTLGERCAKTGWQVHAYCLMGNHFHLVVETPQPNLVAGMNRFFGTYSGRFNRRHKLFGHLFSGRYKALVVDSTLGTDERAARGAALLGGVTGGRRGEGGAVVEGGTGTAEVVWKRSAATGR